MSTRKVTLAELGNEQALLRRLPLSELEKIVDYVTAIARGENPPTPTIYSYMGLRIVRVKRFFTRLFGRIPCLIG